VVIIDVDGKTHFLDVDAVAMPGRQGTNVPLWRPVLGSSSPSDRVEHALAALEPRAAVLELARDLEDGGKPLAKLLLARQGPVDHHVSSPIQCPIFIHPFRLSCIASTNLTSTAHKPTNMLQSSRSAKTEGFPFQSSVLPAYINPSPAATLPGPGSIVTTHATEFCPH